jgi:hypothetical protein
VTLSLLLKTTLAEFNGTLQRSFHVQMALAAGLARADAGRVSSALRAAGRRRLLEAGVAADVSLAMPDAAAATQAAASLTEANINKRLAEAGLPSAQVTAAAQAVGGGTVLPAKSVGTRRRGGGSPGARWPSTTALAAAALAAAALAAAARV